MFLLLLKFDIYFRRCYRLVALLLHQLINQVAINIFHVFAAALCGLYRALRGTGSKTATDS